MQYDCESLGRELPAKAEFVSGHSCPALIKVNEKKHLALFTYLWYNKVNMQANT